MIHSSPIIKYLRVIRSQPFFVKDTKNKSIVNYILEKAIEEAFIDYMSNQQKQENYDDFWIINSQDTWFVKFQAPYGQHCNQNSHNPTANITATAHTKLEKDSIFNTIQILTLYQELTYQRTIIVIMKEKEIWNAIIRLLKIKNPLMIN